MIWRLRESLVLEIDLDYLFKIRLKYEHKVSEIVQRLLCR
jgi:hypothetical protein